MVMFSSQVSQQIYQSQMLMAQQAQNAQMISQQMGLMPQMSALGAMSTGQTGVYGEQVAGRLAGAARTTMGIAGLGVGLAGMVTGLPLDPFSAAWKGGALGMRMGGLGGALGMGALAAAPFMAVSAAADVYGGAFHTGMQQQAATNSVLRSNFNFMGGGGAFGRGFSQQQMGAIGSMISQETRQTPFTTSSELNQLIGQGAESGMFTAVRDVESFSKRFRTMIDGLRKIQKELGGTLQEALQFTRGTQQLGIFNAGTRTAFAAEMRDTMASTGMDQGQLFNLAATGSMLSRATGGLGRQGAFGAIRTARQLGAAVQSGAINNELLSEATGGLQGDEAIQAFTARTLQMSERFSHSARGRYSIFALSNAAGTGLDAGALARFRAGDLSVGGVMRDAHHRVNQMGRARALNMEGQLRGAMLEEGGMSGQIGMMRLMLGERALQGGDDLAQLVMQRRMGMSRQEAQVWTSLMRNQNLIAGQEDTNSLMSQREMERKQDIRLNRSVESFMTNLEHGLQDMTGVTKARELGRRFMTNVSSTVEKAMNNFLGIEGQAMTGGEQASLIRLTSGRGTAKDVANLNFLRTGGGATGASYAGYNDQRSTAQTILDSMSFLGVHSAQSYDSMMMARGVNLRGMDGRVRATAERDRVAAGVGVLNDRQDLVDYQRLIGGGSDAAIQRMITAQRIGGREAIYSAFSGQASANAIDALAYRRGMRLDDVSFTQPGTVASRAGDIAAHGGTGILAGAAAGALAGTFFGGPVGTIGGAVIGGVVGGLGFSGLEFLRTPETSQDKALAWIAGGGHAGAAARRARTARDSAVVTDPATGMRVGTGPVPELSDAHRALLADLDKGVKRETVQAVLEGDTFKNAIRQLPGLQGRAAEQSLQSLKLAANNMKDPEQRRAANVIVDALEGDLAKFGKISASTWGGALGDDKKRAEADQLRLKALSNFDSMKKALDLEGGGAMAKLRDAIGEGGNALFNGGEGANDALMNATRSAAAVLSEMSPEERARAEEIMGATPEGRGLIQVAAARSADIRELSGKGRRGVAGAADALLGKATGFAIGEMDLTLGGKHLKGNKSQVIYREFAKGGKGADELERQLIAQLKGQNVENAEQLIKSARWVLKDKKISESEAGGLSDLFTFDKDLQRLQAEGVQRAREKADPLGAIRNDLLGKILVAVNKTAGIVDETKEGINQSGPNPP